ncbi:MAG TPA: hypothetical protein VKA60_20295 [Blastocatellia bacterium]|nr:hypothetical protein [Blastocatellia bacterium]
MESKTSSQAKARLVIVAVFVIGFAAGALSLNLYQRLTSSRSTPVDPHDRAGVIIQRMDEKVSLSDAQKTQIRQILENSREKYGEIRKEIDPLMKKYEPQFDAVRQQTRNEIRAVLNDEQLPKVEEMFREQDRDRERMQQEEKEKHKK